jgi:hypothetical protein
MPEPPAAPQDVSRSMQASAFRGLGRSLIINALCPYLVYKALTPHFSAHSIVPLGVASLIPILSLLYSALFGRTLDMVALFATEEVLVSLAVVLLAKTPVEVLLAKAYSNALLGLIFFGTLVAGRPLMYYVTRQLAAGSDATSLAKFDKYMFEEGGMRVQWTITATWGVTLILLALLLAALTPILTPDRFLVVAPVTVYITDVALILWSFRYGRARLLEQHNEIAKEEAA